MSDASAGALKRKVGGTKSGFFGETVDVKGKYTEEGYVTSRPNAEIPFLGFLVVVGASHGVSCRARVRTTVLPSVVALTRVTHAQCWASWPPPWWSLHAQAKHPSTQRAL